MHDTDESVRQALATGARRLDSRHEAELLLMHSLGVDRVWLFMHADAVIERGARARYGALLERRESGEPVAYMLGRQGFWTFDLEVTPATLIPRPETERLVELALERLPAERPLRVADLGTGSGAVALAIASERPQAQVLATDASVGALAVARRNAGRLGIDNVRFAPGDWCEPLGSETFDLIVSNPPYIELGDPHLAQGDLRFEPAAALASGRDGLDAIRRIAGDAPVHLRAGGILLLEHGWNQGAAVRAVLAGAGLQQVFTETDLETRDRISGGCVSAEGVRG